jgi:hypothetical protein
MSGVVPLLRHIASRRGQGKFCYLRFQIPQKEGQRLPPPFQKRFLYSLEVRTAKHREEDKSLFAGKFFRETHEREIPSGLNFLENEAATFVTALTSYLTFLKVHSSYPFLNALGLPFI